MTLFMNACAFLVKVLTLPLHIAEVIGLFSFYKRVFPLIVYKMSISYNEKMKDNKRELFRNLEKFHPTKGSLRILEVGCGSGANFEHYPTGCRITCTDPNPHFQKYLKKCMTKNDHLVYDSFIVASGENLKAVEDNSVDVVVCTLVLCSVEDTPKVLQEAKRVLRPVSLDHKKVYTCMFVRYYFGDGCEATRATWKHLEAAGFSDLKLRHIQANLLFLLKPQIAGYPVK
uniref:Methyltransferase like 7A n=1 Tax=Cyprinus carpio TaxID=7962 RepID=A0A8C1TI10_CYPCA